jgi:hypothetical protein
MGKSKHRVNGDCYVDDGRIRLPAAAALSSGRIAWVGDDG